MLYLSSRLMKTGFLVSSLLIGMGSINLSYAESSVATASVAQVNQSDEHIVWQRAPISISLPVGKERFVTFPTEVQFGYNIHHLPASVLRVENDNQTLYLTAKQPFPVERVQAKLNNGNIILIDLSAQVDGENRPIDIVLPQKPVSSSFSPVGDHYYASNGRVDYVSLTRFAVQQLYAPERLLNTSSGITRFPMGTAHVVPLVYDKSLSAMPLASWRGNNLYVTAVLMKNQLNQPIRLDPRLICGSWQAATFYPQTTLSPRGTPINRDTSTLFVVSERPFSEAIQTCLH